MSRFILRRLLELVPVIFGVLTTDTVQQARERLGKGAEAALAALEMANLVRALCPTSTGVMNHAPTESGRPRD